MRLLATLILLFLIFPDLVSENRIALVIGNGDYEHCDDLLNPANDAVAIAGMLEKLGYEVMLRNNLGYQELRMAIDEFGDRLPGNESGLFYFAGHGIQVGGYNYLVPVDASIHSERQVEYNCVRVGRVLSRMEENDGTTNIIILDACRDNPFETSWSRSLQGKGLAFMEAPAGSLIAYATSPGSTASDGEGTNGLYTSVLLDYIGDPNLNILQVYQNVRKNVRLKSGGQQVPWESTSLEGDFYLNQTGSRIDYLAEKNQKDEKEITDNIREDDLLKYIKKDSNYIWSEAYSALLIDADEEAKRKLSVEANDYILSLYGDNITSGNSSPVFRSASQENSLHLNSIVSLGSRNVVGRRGKTYVVRYIDKKQVRDYLVDLDHQVQTFYTDGEQAEKEGRIGDALKYYHWTAATSSQHPAGSLFSFKRLDIEFQQADEPVRDVAERKIGTIIRNITCTLVDSLKSKNDVVYRLNFIHKERIISDLTYQYSGGDSWSRPIVMNSEAGVLRLAETDDLGKIRIRILYHNLSKAKYDTKLYEAVNHSLSHNPDYYILPVPAHGGLSKSSEETTLSADAELENLQPLIQKLNQKLQQDDVQYDEELFTENGFEVFSKLLLYGNASFFPADTSYRIVHYNDMTLIRGLPVRFSFSNNDADFIEKLCIELTPDYRIENISFTLGSEAMNDILSHSRWSDDDKWQIISFLENYKTAYALERIDYIDQIFSDNALIIVGRKVRVAEQTDKIKLNLEDNKYELINLSKEQYIYRLRRVFDRNEFINIQFETNTVRKRDNQTDVFGINIKQNYFSSTYADQGYLFLIVDLQEKNNAKIYVRAWQPEKFNDGSVINLSHFNY